MELVLVLFRFLNPCTKFIIACVRIYRKSKGIYTFAAPIDLANHQLILKLLWVKK